MMEFVEEEVAITLYSEMLRIRMIEETIAEKYSEQKMRCPVHLSLGQEAVAVGVAQSITKEDYFVSNHRAHAHYLAKGGSLPKMIAEIYGKVTGCSLGRGGSMHLVDLEAGMLGSTPIVGGSLPVGVGAAFASKLKGDSRLTIIFIGEGATEEGVFAECLNFASLRKLPVLFICENNLYSVYSPLDVRQSPDRDRVGIAKAHGLFAKSGNGNNVEEVFKLSKEAVDWIKSGNGSAFLEVSTYRFREHCGPNFDNHIGYRTEDEYLAWKEKCPVQNYEEYLINKSLLSNDSVRELKEKIVNEIKEAFDFAENSPFPIYDQNESVYAL